MTIYDLIEILKNKSHANFAAALDIYLKQSGKKVSDADAVGHTLLVSAAIRGKEEAIPLLLDRGAKVDQKCNLGRTPLMYAVRFKKRRVMSLLLAAGAKINETDRDGCTALMWATYEWDIESTRFLVEKGADIEMRNSGGMTALIWAIDTNDCFNIVDYLLEQGAAINKKDNQGRSPLSIAINRNFDHVTEVLLWRGAQLAETLKITTLYSFEIRGLNFKKTVFNLLKKIGRSIPLSAIPEGENCSEIQKYNTEVVQHAQLSGAEVASNLGLKQNCIDLVADYLYADEERRGLFYQAFSEQQALTMAVEIPKKLENKTYSKRAMR